MSFADCSGVPSPDPLSPTTAPGQRLKRYNPGKGSIGTHHAPVVQNTPVQDPQPNNTLMTKSPMNPNQALWEKGDFTRIAESMRESGESLVQRIGVSKGVKVLDLGCGDGTTAIPAAKLGADVLGVDIARNLVEAGNKRVKEQGLTNCKFQEGDATNLHELKDKTFD